jgi:hypothetical protein
MITHTLKINNMKFLLKIFFYAAVTFLNSAYAQALRALSDDYVIHTSSKHVKVNDGIRVKYEFTVTNNSNNLIYDFRIGQKSLVDRAPTIPIEYVNEYNNLLFNFPQNWTAHSQDSDGSTFNSFRWYISNSLTDKGVIKPGIIQTGFGVTTLKRYPEILKSYAEIDSSEQGEKTAVVKLIKSDTIPPNGKIIAIMLPRKNLSNILQISISVAAKDNYDPLPEITFDSVQDITSISTGVPISPFGAGYTLNVANDITRGVYPTVITIPADAKIAKKYRINYKITDASDNQTTVSTVVTIPKQ